MTRRFLRHGCGRSPIASLAHRQRRTTLHKKYGYASAVQMPAASTISADGSPRSLDGSVFKHATDNERSSKGLLETRAQIDPLMSEGPAKSWRIWVLHSSRRSFFTVCRRRRRIYMGREQFLKSPSSGEPPAGAMPATWDCATETRLRGAGRVQEAHDSVRCDLRHLNRKGSDQAAWSGGPSSRMRIRPSSRALSASSATYSSSTTTIRSG